MRAVSALPVSAAAAAAQTTASTYAQCGGIGYTAPAVPGTPARHTSEKEPPLATVIPTTLATTMTSPGAPGTTTGALTPTSLEPGWLWIRAVATPNYRSYLQAAPTGIPPAFNVVAGQLVYNRFEAALLYMNVENPAVKTQRKLWTKFVATKNAYGTFAFQGDTLIWSVADIARPNLAAWLVCEGEEVFVNTGAFLYDTPAGCFDHTIHSYGNSIADL
ncbi:hypothetical protein B0H67DRAFT_673130 [Lasiosphaeris hirsuta]|uniref:Uncharacterized protein n=1 Tax=Lasiosphaeris hirsuta TaxID=260670 RepID=A0AA40DLK6_9PEZI|nr:hypothetical protein B0H67DRAFT_673130 [Lasiosphaeris hirsuta]